MFQVQYGHEFNNNYDVAIDIGGQFITLDKSSVMEAWNLIEPYYC
jgi:hypothetical protein